MEEKLDAENCELASVSATSGKFVVYSREQVQAVLNRLA
jgi:hypothetical protein